MSASGTPCWINLSAMDVSRAQKFYSSVFNWTFKDTEPGSPFPPDEIAFFDPPDKSRSPGGAISKAKKAHHFKMVGTSGGDAGLYLLVDDMEKYMKRVIDAGGKKASEPASVGPNMGTMQHFEDTEGNYLGMYQAPENE